jgi:hypothetical protein
VIPIALNGEVRDPEGDERSLCGAIAPPLVHRFKILSQPTLDGSLGLPVKGGCLAEPATPRVTELVTSGTMVCLYPDKSYKGSTAGSYTVQLAVDDDHTTVTTEPLLLTVLDDAPACLDGTYPTVGSYVLARDLPALFQAVGVDGVQAAPAIRYEWSMRRAGESAYSVVTPSTSGNDGGARFVLDPSVYGFAVGERISLRVEVLDPNGGPACEATDDRCDVASCAVQPAKTCARRATWDLELR